MYSKRKQRHKLKHSEIADIFEATVGGKFAAINLLEDNIYSMTEKLKDVLLESTTETHSEKREKIKHTVGYKRHSGFM